MRILEQYINSAVFICTASDIGHGLERIPVATAFFVTLQDDVESNISWPYLVTARHVLEEVGPDEMYIRINKRSQGFEDFPTKRDDWITHDTADVAILLLNPNRGAMSLSVSFIALNAFIDVNYQHRTSGITVGVGDEIFFVGLFLQHAGRERNLPIVRFGNISRMPVEPITLRASGGHGTVDVIAYLAECRSWGGHSGSPVFWTYPAVRQQWPPKEGLNMVEVGQIISFLGLVSAHFEIPKKAEITGDIVGSIETAINAGIAVITPAEAIRQLLMQEDVMEDRKKRRQRIIAQRPAATPDAVIDKQTSITRETFEEVLRKVSRPDSPQPDEEKTETSE
jgi:hypothetical protein